MDSLAQKSGPPLSALGSPSPPLLACVLYQMICYFAVRPRRGVAALSPGTFSWSVLMKENLISITQRMGFMKWASLCKLPVWDLGQCSLSMPQLSHLQEGNNNHDLVELFAGSRLDICMKFLALSRDSNYDICYRHHHYH